MRKYLLLLSLQLVFLPICAKSYTFDYSVEEFSFQPDPSGAVFIKAPIKYFYDESPEPAIPCDYACIALNYGYEMDNCSISHSEPRLIKENIVLSINPLPLPTRPGTSNPDEAPPTPTGVYPKSNALYRQINYLYEIPYLSFDICPFVYDSDARKLYFIDRFTIDIDCKKVLAKDQPKVDRWQVKERLLDVVANPEEIDDILDRVPKFAAYQPLFVDGRMWKAVHGSISGDPSSDSSMMTHQVLTVTVDGDAYINGKKCKRLKVVEQTPASKATPGTPASCEVCIPSSESTFYCYGYEADRQIYVCRDGEAEFRLYMDLNGNYGDFAKGFGTIMNETCEEHSGLICRTLTAGYADRLGIVEKKNWMEGIGSNVLANCLTNTSAAATSSQPANYLVLCEQDGTPLYDIRDRLTAHGIDYGDGTTSLPFLSSSDSSEPTYYTLEGLRVDNPAQGHFYIKVVGSKASKIKF